MSRPPEDRMVTMRNGAERLGYAPEYLRKLMWADNPPPFFKFRGRWRAWLSELDAWADEERRHGEDW